MIKKLFSIFCCLLLSAMSVMFGQNISFHCDYSDILVNEEAIAQYELQEDDGSSFYYSNVVHLAAKNADNNGFEVYFARRDDSYTASYGGGQCPNNTLGAVADTYTLYLANSARICDYDVWEIPAGNSIVCYRKVDCGRGYSPRYPETSYYSYVLSGGNPYKLRGNADLGGQIVVSENNVGGLFIETVNCQDYDRTRNIYFTFGNRSENTINLGTGSMTLNSSLTMTATSGNNSTNIKINSASTGSFDQSSFDMGNTSFTYNGSAVTIGKISATVSQSGSTYTIVATIRDNQENVYFVTMSAVAGGTEYTISTVISPSNTYGTVTGAGSYTENSVVTLTATSANEHLYIFDHWLKDGNNYAGGATITPTVTANATYTAVFRNAVEGAITGVANYGTISGTGHYTGGSAVTLTVTPNSGYKFAQWSDGNEDNPRTVYVDGDATYTAQFTDLNQPLLASFSWETDNISIETYGDGDGLCNSFYSPASKQFHLLYAKANNRSTKNYLNLSIQSSQTYMWGDVSFFKPGSYPVVSSGYTTGRCGNNGPYWYWTLDQTDVCVAYGYDSYNLGLNPLSSYLCDKSGNADDDSDQSNYISVGEGITCIIEVGANGDPYVRLVRNTDQQCLVSVGAPAVKYTLAWDANGGELSGTYTAAGSVNEGTSITAPTATRTGYTFTGWSPAFTGTMPSNNATYTAQWSSIIYHINYEGLNNTTNNNPTTYTIETQTINLINPGERDGYNFTGWTMNGEPITEIPNGSTGDLTITANWEEVPTVINLILQENENDEYYNTFAAKYNNKTVNTVTLNRQFVKGRWSTLCLPFDVNKGMMTSLHMAGRVFEFRYATGNADLGGGLNLYFAQAKSIKAGIPYIVNANEQLASKTSFVFPNVTINTTADSVPTLALLTDYNRLGGHKSSGTIELVGTMRKGILKSDGKDERYMGLKDNHVYYPNTTSGSTIYAYRAVFRSTEPLNIQQVRIVAEDLADSIYELTLEDIQIFDANKKYIKDGVLYIEYNGEVYNALGQKIN